MSSVDPDGHSPFCINCGVGLLSHIGHKCLYASTTWKPRWCASCGCAFQTANKWLPRTDFRPQLLAPSHVDCRGEWSWFVFREDAFMVLNDLTVRNPSYAFYDKTYRKFAPDGAVVMSVSIMNSTFDRVFVEETFRLVANGRPITQCEVSGRDVGSNVMGGAQKYFLQFA